MKKIGNILFAFTALTLAVSCEDVLNKYPLDDLTEEAYFENAVQLQIFTNSLYSSLLPDAPYDEQSDLMVANNPGDLVLNGSYRTMPASGGCMSGGAGNFCARQRRSWKAASSTRKTCTMTASTW